jgi:hypothetical protein
MVDAVMDLSRSIVGQEATDPTTLIDLALALGGHSLDLGTVARVLDVAYL